MRIVLAAILVALTSSGASSAQEIGFLPAPEPAVERTPIEQTSDNERSQAAVVVQADECALCSDAEVVQQNGDTIMVHFWHGTELCEFGGPDCAECDESDCDDPVKSYAGECPATLCSGESPDLAAVLARLDTVDLEWLVEQVKATPGRYGFDHRRSAFQAFDCGGALALHVAVSGEVAVALRNATQ